MSREDPRRQYLRLELDDLLLVEEALYSLKDDPPLGTSVEEIEKLILRVTQKIELHPNNLQREAI